MTIMRRAPNHAAMPLGSLRIKSGPFVDAGSELVLNSSGRGNTNDKTSCVKPLAHVLALILIGGGHRR